MARQRQHGVRPRFDAAARHAREVHAEKRKARIGHRVDQVLHEKLAFGRQRRVLASERHDAHARINAARARHAVGVEPGTIHEHSARERPGGGVERDARALAPRLTQPHSRADRRAAATNAPRVGLAHVGVVDDSRLRDEQRGLAADMRLARADFVGGQPAHAGQAVGDAAALEFAQALDLVGLGGDHDLAAALVLHAVRGAERVHLVAALDAQTRLERAGFVVEP